MRSGWRVAAVLALAACKGGAPVPALRSDLERVRQEARQAREESTQLGQQVQQLQQQQTQLRQELQQLQQQQAQLGATTLQAEGAPPERTGVLSGTVMSRRGDALVVRDPLGAEFDLRLDARTLVSREGRPMDRRTVRTGTDVRASFDPAQERWVARSVEVVEPPPAGQARRPLSPRPSPPPAPPEGGQ
jgi:multidrug efflux pump subunit AcrA (membrane-fusion protein)